MKSESGMVKNDRGRKVFVQDWQLIEFQESWDRQKTLLDSIIEKKRAGNPYASNYLIFCEHPHVFTLGKKGKKEHILISDQQIDQEQIQVFPINRGGDITYHGPGQIVCYPILDLDQFFTDIHKYIRYLEEIVIRTLADYNIKGFRIQKYTGVWVGDPKDQIQRKICAIGVHLSRWVTMHGLAFNISSNLDYFDKIIPCGIVDPEKTVTSLSQELGRSISMEEVKQKMAYHFQNLFKANLL